LGAQMIGTNTMSDVLKDFDQRLQRSGLKQIATNTENEGGDEITHIFYTSNVGTLRVSHSIRDGLSCWVSDLKNNHTTTEDNWDSIYSRVVPGFDDFDTNQKFEWIVHSPRGSAFFDRLENFIGQWLEDKI
jgi:hypothetical protein